MHLERECLEVVLKLIHVKVDDRFPLLELFLSHICRFKILVNCDFLASQTRLLIVECVIRILHKSQYKRLEYTLTFNEHEVLLTNKTLHLLTWVAQIIVSCHPIAINQENPLIHLEILHV